MNNTIIIKTVNLSNEIHKRCAEKGVPYKTMIKNLNSKESAMQRMYEALPLFTSMCRSLGFNFFELYTDNAELREKIKNLEAELAALKQSTERIAVEHAVYKDTMEILKRHVTLPVAFHADTIMERKIKEV